MNEFIICAAIWYDDGEIYKDQPININTGFVVAGRRHYNCLETLKILNKTLDNKISENRNNQGFLTSLDRYVNRKEAWTIAKKNNQIQFGLMASDNGEDSILISENLY